MSDTKAKSITFTKNNLLKAEKGSIKLFGNKKRVSDYINYLLNKEKI